MPKIVRYIILTLVSTILILTGCLPTIRKEVPNEQIKLLEGKEGITFSSEAKSRLIEKYKREARESDFYWQSLTKEMKELKTLHPGITTIESIHLQIFMETGWGFLILHSVPSEADIHLRDSWTPSEGRTTLRKYYPDSSYTFELKKEGYKQKEVNVTIVANDTTKVSVTLEKEEKTKMIKPEILEKPDTLERKPKFPDWKEGR